MYIVYKHGRIEESSDRSKRQAGRTTTGDRKVRKWQTFD